MIWRRRFLFEGVNCRARQMPRLQRFTQSCFIHKPGVSAVHQAGAGLHLGEFFPAEHVVGFWCIGGVQAEDICSRQQLFEIDHFYTPGASISQVDIRVISQDAHPKALGAGSHFAPQAPETDDAELFTFQLETQHGVTRPVSAAHGAVSTRDIAGHRQQHGKGMFCHCHQVGVRCVDHQDAPAGGGIDVNMVELRPGAR